MCIPSKIPKFIDKIIFFPYSDFKSHLICGEGILIMGTFNIFYSNNDLMNLKLLKILVFIIIKIF